MEKIDSFKINHDCHPIGFYLSKQMGDIYTYDLRMKTPNGGDYLGYAELHTFEHLFATYARNSIYRDSVVYVGPMGCRTGFYLLLRDTVSGREAIDLVRQSFSFISAFEGKIPGAKRRECGNWLEHDLENAKQEAAAYLKVLGDCNADTMAYPE